MNAPERIPFATALPDTQAQADYRRVAIQQVGIKALRYPLQVGGNGVGQTAAADWAITVGLPAEVKGTHMSRFVEALEALPADRPIDGTGFLALHSDVLRRLGASTGRTHATFPFFISKTAPVSGVKSLTDLDAGWLAETTPNGQTRLTTTVAASAR
jgi:GTP cyclohydrolase IB